MAQRYLVTAFVGDGARFVVDLTMNGFPVDAAAWVYEEDSDDWELHLATPVVDAEGKLEAHIRMRELTNRQNPRIAGVDAPIVLTEARDPLLTALVEAAAQRGRLGVVQLRNTTAAGHFVDGALVYWPLPTSERDLEALAV